MLRAGFGLFFDRYPLAFLNDAIQKDNRQGFEQYAVGDSATQVFSVTRGARLPEPFGALQRSAYVVDPDFPTTYSRKFAVSVERSFGHDTTLAAEVASVRGFHLPRIRNRAGTLPPTYQLEQTARSTFLGGSITLNRRMRRELAFLLAYNVGRAHDDASDYDEHPLDPFDLRRDWARSRQHQTHRLAASALFELPVEKVRSCPEWLRQSLEHISLAPILTAGSGRPLNALTSTDTFRTGAYPLSARPSGLPRNPFWSPGVVNMDLRLMKTIFLWRERALAPIRSRGFQSDEPFKSAACQSLLCFTRSPAGFIRPSDGNSECAANPVAGAVGVLTCDGLVRVRSGLSLTLVPETFPAILAVLAD